MRPIEVSERLRAERADRAKALRPLAHKPTKFGLFCAMLLSLACGGLGGATIQRVMTRAPVKPVEIEAAKPKVDAARPEQTSQKAFVDAKPYVLTRNTETSNLFLIPVQSKISRPEVKFAVDTGAEVTILREQDAETMGAIPADLHNREIIVIGSVMPLKGATVPRMRMAGVEFADVEVLIAPNNLPFSLLGQKEISRLGSVEFDGDTMRVRPSRSDEITE